MSEASPPHPGDAAALPAPAARPYHLFEAYGVELEYMIVDAAALDVAPLAEEVLRASPGGGPDIPPDATPDDVEFEDMTWSNELVSHVIELKTSAPAPRLAGLAKHFQDHVARIEARLAPRGARLMPTAMHPWMNPEKEVKLWPYGNHEVYEAYNRIFDCRGHGWSNVQSVHLNLPFANDEEFGKLHAAVRAILPILPALAASSPYRQGLRGCFDERLREYACNQSRIPEIAGLIIPEAVYTRADYERVILNAAYCAIAPHDPQGILQHEWLNSRGAIARFDRNTIEVRVLDIQECPAADLAILALIVEVLRALIMERWAPLAALMALKTEILSGHFRRVVVSGDRAPLDNQDYLRVFGWPPGKGCSSGDLWRFLADSVWPSGPPADCREPLRVILGQGSLSRRILVAHKALPARSEPRQLAFDAYHDVGLEPGQLRETYAALADCLRAGRMFEP